MEDMSAQAAERRSGAQRPAGVSLIAALRPTDARPAVLTVVVVSVLIGIAAAAKLLLLAVTFSNAGYLLYIPAIAAAAWYRGFLGGVLATLLAALVDLGLIATRLGFSSTDAASAELRLVAFVVAGITVSFVSHLLRSQRDGARREALAHRRALLKAADAQREVERVMAMERRANELRDAFNGIVSHELRTPITAIYGGAKLLARRDRELGEATKRDLIDDLEAEADRLYRLVEDLLVLAKAEKGTVDRMTEPLMLSRMIARVVRSERERWPRIHFNVRTGDPVATARGDETYVEQVIRNLLSNAAKYSAPGSVVEVIVDEIEEGVRVRVLDAGVGIKADEAARLFELYYRSPTTSPTVSGAGIGLYVCRVLIEAMGGRVWGRPREGGGAEFGFVLERDEEDDVADELAELPQVRTAARELPVDAGPVPETALSPVGARPGEQ